jgi:hypothetical protein
MRDIKVTAIEATGPVQKYAGRTASASNWGFPVLYTLADGRKVESYERGYSKKKDATDALAQMPQSPPLHYTSVELDANGKVFMTSIVIGRQFA